jgi:TM2 domain-containing membrane protein YozV
MSEFNPLEDGSTAEERNMGQATPAPAGYCRICGRALAESDLRRFGGTIYCGEHVPGRPPEPTETPRSEYQRGEGGSPGLAFLLGLIPGVGAIYNGQYAKGLIHLMVFGLLISILQSGPGGLGAMFSLLVAGFYFYMPFESYHTARRRRRGEAVDEFSSILPIRAKSDSVAGPVALIGGGLVFLLINLDVIDLGEAVRYWPMILIAVGLYMLYARRRAASEPTERDRRGEL